jgi:16S rRNA (cytosine967-C5)-methyltransferase
VRTVLLLGTYQVLFMRVPARAAVSTSVELVRELHGPRATGLVNAVLRRVAEHDWEEWVRRLAPADPIGRIAFTTGNPEWIVAAIAEALDGDLAEAAASLDPAPPVVHLLARPGRIGRDELLAAAGPGSQPTPWSPYGVRLSAGDPADLAAVRSGEAGVQDEGSQLVAAAVAAAPLEGPDTGRWLDVCAGPGGKAALLEGLLPPGGRLLAADLAPHRARLVAGALTRSPVVVADGTSPAWRSGFDRVLVDAPCTGLGALRRRPEVRWRRRPDDVGPLAALQRTLLRAALGVVRPGGVVAYATCSPHPAETTGVVDAVLADDPGAERLDAWAALPPVLPRGATAGDVRDVQLWPHRHGTDAMFLALLRRRGPAASA